jgi:hypothetical protein
MTMVMLVVMVMMQWTVLQMLYKNNQVILGQSSDYRSRNYHQGITYSGVQYENERYVCLTGSAVPLDSKVLATCAERKWAGYINLAPKLRACRLKEGDY